MRMFTGLADFTLPHDVLRQSAGVGRTGKMVVSLGLLPEPVSTQMAAHGMMSTEDLAG